MVAYHHEPEAHHSDAFGTPAQFIAAWRKVVAIFDAQGATNVEWTWQMTAYSFRAKATDGRAAIKWYPGDAYVDNVGADGYNWGRCYGHSGAWLSFASFTDPVVAFARAHGKKASLAEFGAVPDSRRAQWLRDAGAYLAARKDVITAAFYFQNGGTRSTDTCSWALKTAAEFDAYGDIARNTTTFRS
jgi:beta-mannanase